MYKTKMSEDVSLMEGTGKNPSLAPVVVLETLLLYLIFKSSSEFSLLRGPWSLLSFHNSQPQLTKHKIESLNVDHFQLHTLMFPSPVPFLSPEAAPIVYPVDISQFK